MQEMQRALSIKGRTNLLSVPLKYISIISHFSAVKQFNEQILLVVRFCTSSRSVLAFLGEL